MFVACLLWHPDRNEANTNSTNNCAKGRALLLSRESFIVCPYEVN